MQALAGPEVRPDVLWPVVGQVRVRAAVGGRKVALAAVEVCRCSLFPLSDRKNRQLFLSRTFSANFQSLRPVCLAGLG